MQRIVAISAADGQLKAQNEIKLGNKAESANVARFANNPTHYRRPANC
jgi:hypothetical protein